ncbi:MAG: hypothetical protein HY958_14350 [Bacteroidia bacterium]|nr:hypothetical protein [Bacteroidia bacterium]
MNKISNKQLTGFIFKKHIEKSLKSNAADWIHLKTVLLSYRKLAISNDKNLRNDINHYPGYNAIAAARPNELNYE